MKKLLVGFAALLIAFGSGTRITTAGETKNTSRIHLTNQQTYHVTTGDVTFHETDTETEATV
jgi:hypothetical protein